MHQILPTIKGIVHNNNSCKLNAEEKCLYRSNYISNKYQIDFFVVVARVIRATLSICRRND